MDDCFLKNGDPENRQQGTVAAPVKYGIAFLRDAFPAGDGAHGTAARPCSGCRRLPCFPSSRKAYPKMPALSKMAGNRGLCGSIASLFCGACRRAPRRIAFSALRAGDGRHPVHAAGIHRKIGCLFDGADLLMVLACLLMSVMRLTPPCRERHRRCCCHRSRPAARVPAG